MKITNRQLRRIIRESVLNEAYADTIGSGDPVQEILQWAEEGNRVTVAGKNIWPGLGNRSGLHSYGDDMVREKWYKSGDRFAKKLEKLPAGTEVELKRFKNTNRDRGKWITAGTVTIPVIAPSAGDQPNRKVLKALYEMLGFIKERRVGATDIASISPYPGSDAPFRGKVWYIKMKGRGDEYLFPDDPNATEIADKYDGGWEPFQPY